jgi:tRNA (mo5U34)-methyltransferase
MARHRGLRRKQHDGVDGRAMGTLRMLMDGSTDKREQIARILAKYDWWHTIELGDGIITPGGWDIRHMTRQIPWPGALRGMRCLDVGTRDGFWAFEMERLGASEVVAVDVPYSETDAPYYRRAGLAGRPGHWKQGETFGVLRELRGSRALFQMKNIYDLRPQEVGTFDVVFVGYMLHQLRDPARALEATRGVCRGSVIVLDQIMYFRSLLSREPLARFAARPGYMDWFTFNAAGLRRIVELAGFRVVSSSPFLYYRAGPGVKQADISLRTKLKYSLGRAACSLAVRGEVG